ncbi:UDP-2,4-diacetamido-2,4,6-trideoxy-beta-L-altropyranose hydrolase, partial [Akkermansiaceae bacterium]|nr:UDP-2,4-diacetamido-2,4,6-trideoxy-beta-L-altropyranose hydrolase [Akkermansiaceae bacterium]
MKPLLIRADAGGQIGTGHVMRMIALAQAYQRRGGRVIIATSTCPEAVAQRVTDLGIEHQAFISDQPGSQADAAETLSLANSLGIAWLVLDGYHFSLSSQQFFKDAPFQILVTDDHGYSDRWCCDALLNQNLDSDLSPHGSHELADPQLLLGSSFTLLREEFLSQPVAPRNWSSLKKILISMGGADPHNATQAVLDLLDQSDAAPLNIRILAGAANPHLDQLRAHTSDHHIEIVVNAQDMPDQLAWADGIISAGGSTCWEWLHAGLPGAIVTIAENQIPIVHALTESRKAALALGWPHDFSSPTDLSAWLADPNSV